MTALNPPSSLEEVLKLPPAQFDSYWKEIDGIVATLPTSSDQITAWESILECLRHHPFSKGMPYFRLGVLHLLTDPDAARAVQELELAYLEDRHYGPDTGKLPHRMGAYRLLALTKGFLDYLRIDKHFELRDLNAPQPV